MPNIDAMDATDADASTAGSASCSPTKGTCSARRSGSPTARATTCAGSTTRPRSTRDSRPAPTSPASPRPPTGELLCHEGMSLAAAGDAVAPLGPGGDDAGGARPAPLHPHQALPDGLGAGAGPGRHVQRGDRGPPLQPEGQRRARRPRDRLPARLDPGDGLQRRRRGPEARSASRRRSSTRS